MHRRSPRCARGRASLRCVGINPQQFHDGGFELAEAVEAFDSSALEAQTPHERSLRAVLDGEIRRLQAPLRLIQPQPTPPDETQTPR